MSNSETALVPKATTDLIKPEPQAGKLARLAAFTPQTLTEAIALSKLIAASELAPKDFKGKPANVLIAMQMGAEVGLAPMQSLQNIAVINGRPSLWGDAALGVVQVHPDYEWHKESWDGQGDNRKAVFQIKRRGSEIHTTQFGVMDAKKAQLWGKAGPWQTYPDRMLQMRARGFGLRDKFADALRGLSIAEEAMDMAPDTSEAKKQREMATLDVGGISTLTPSSEPNRGHDDTGLTQTKPEQSSPKEKTMCAECSQIDGHLPDCKYAQQDKKTAQFTKAAFMILDVLDKKDKSKKPYLVLEVVDPQDHQGKLYVWHQSIHDDLRKAKGQSLECEMSAQEKDGKRFHNLEKIVNLAGVPYVDNKPAQQGEMPTREPGTDDEPF